MVSLELRLHMMTKKTSKPKFTKIERDRFQLFIELKWIDPFQEKNRSFQKLIKERHKKAMFINN